MLQEVGPPFVPAGAHVMTLVIEHPPGDYQDGNNRDDIPVRFIVTMLCGVSGSMITLVDDDELAQRRERRIPRTV